MQEKTVLFFKNFITNRKSLNSKEIDGLIYGLNVLYIFISKSLFIFTLAFIFNIEKELFLLLIFFNINRFFAGGIHLKDSTLCYIISAFSFLVLSFLIKFLMFNSLFLLLFSFSLISFILYSPADTRKKPIINYKKRLVLKVFSIIICIIYFLISIFIKNKLLIYVLIFSSVFESILILPITYKLFKEPYGNYKYYK